MSNHDNLIQANELGNTIAKLLNTPPSQSTQVDETVKGLIISLAAKAQELLNPVIITNAGGLDDLVIGTGDTAHIHGNGDVELLRSTAHTITEKRDQLLPAGPTLQSYFEGNLSMDVIDFRLRTCRLPGGGVGFYLHPAQRSGETAQFTINGNTLTTHVEV